MFQVNLMSNSEDTPFGCDRYVSEMNYTHDYHEGLDPLSMSFLAYWKMNAGVRANRPFRYFELGSGNGVTINVLAASNAHGEFYANDFNPDHCANLRSLAKAGGVENLTVFEMSFEELLKVELPAFDFICLHGVLSWVSDENRSHIFRFIDRQLAEGGLVYISYNCAAGNAGFTPVQRFLWEYSDGFSGTSEESITSAFRFLWETKDQLPFFKVFQNEREKLDSYGKRSRSYIAHELFNRDWKNFYQKDLAAELSGIGLGYFASRDFVQNIPEYLMGGETLNAYRSIESEDLKMMFEDFALGKRFRKDLYLRRAEWKMGAAEDNCLSEARLVALKHSDELLRDQEIPVGSVRLEKPIYRELLESLMEGPKALSEFECLIERSGEGCSGFLERVNKLIALEFVAPCFSSLRADENERSSARFNRSIMGRDVNGRRYAHFASPLIGKGVQIGRLDQCFIKARMNGVDPIGYVMEKTPDERQRIIGEGGSSLKGGDVEAEYAKSLATAFPLFRKLGIETG